MSGANQQERLLKVAWIGEWKPSLRNAKGKLEIDGDQVKAGIRYVCQTFAPLWFGYDPAVGAHLIAQDMRKEGLFMTEYRFTPSTCSEMATAFMKVVGLSRTTS